MRSEASRKHFDCHRDLLFKMNLPANLVYWIREGTLFEAIEEAYAKHNALLAVMEQWELSSPELARQCPWYEAREQWKAEGRPAPEWYEVLIWHGPNLGRCPAPLTARILQYEFGIGQVEQAERSRRKRTLEGKIPLVRKPFWMTEEQWKKCPRREPAR